MTEPPPAPAVARRILRVAPLEAATFAPYGEVIDRSSREPTLAINAGTADRLNDLARVDASARGGHVGLSIFRARPRPLPFRLQCMERHLHTSQAFVPLAGAAWIVIVAPRGQAPQPGALRAFMASATQGVNYARGTWHHPLIALGREAEFLVVDRVAEDGTEDCEVHDLAAADLWLDGNAAS